MPSLKLYFSFTEVAKTVVKRENLAATLNQLPVQFLAALRVGDRVSISSARKKLIFSVAQRSLIIASPTNGGSSMEDMVINNTYFEIELDYPAR